MTAVPASRFFQTALHYGNTWGWEIRPLVPGQKRPAIETGEGHSEAARDHGKIRAWWTNQPNANIGIATGLRSCLAVLDIDPRKGGLETLRSFREQHGDEWLSTRTAITGRGDGGHHYYFELDEELPSCDLGPGVQLIAARKYVVAPPSIHPDTGRSYTWQDSNRSLAPLPPFLRDRAKTIARARLPQGVGGGVIQEGQRNVTLFREASSLRAHGLDQAALHILLSEMNATRCNPPLPSGEVARIAASAARYSQQLPCTELGNAYRFVIAHGHLIRYCPEVGRWLIWSGQRWEWDSDGGIERLAKQTVRNIYAEAARESDEARRAELGRWGAASQSAARIEATIKLAKSESDVPIPICKLDADPLLLGVQNGVIDLRTGTRQPARREDYITKRALVEYDPQADCPRWHAFLDRIFAGDAELIAFVQRMVGYFLTGETKEQCLSILYGTGANGKSVFATTLKRLLGDYAMQTPAETLMTRPSQGSGPSADLARLRGARFVLASEPSEGCILAEAIVKQMTGQDTIVCRPLYRDYFEYIPAFKITLVTNHEPIIPGDDHAIWRRIRLIPFKVTIPADERDPDLADKLWAELPGILNWAIEGCRQWQRGGLRPPQSVIKATQAYRDEMDILGDWLNDCCIQDPQAETPTGDLHKSYKDWSEDKGYRPLSHNNFSRKLRNRGFESGRTASARFFRGLRLKPAVPVSPLVNAPVIGAMDT